ncbi:hypothetical protein NI17_005985 [Thermobifida halotolerans]|uniref:Uncharacterized protein n=1 Tax=Thermobifida halotolerans TaxID=483545 RepID=A0AA97M595_9ACTN|nr:hypothetical protein [Thermobifida halotolerans]UOE20747.1 hypothetical protein NI17_005985 [Thermobifida halotolerans]
MTDPGTDLAALAADGAAGLVQAMAADVWAAVRDRFAALFGRGRDAAVAELEQARDEVTEDAELADEVRTEWRSRLRRLLKNSPDAATGLRAILDELASENPLGGVSGTIHGGVTGTVVQAHTVHGGVTATSHGGDHIDFGGVFHRPVIGRTVPPPAS